MLGKYRELTNSKTIFALTIWYAHPKCAILKTNSLRFKQGIYSSGSGTDMAKQSVRGSTVRRANVMEVEEPVFLLPKLSDELLNKITDVLEIDDEAARETLQQHMRKLAWKYAIEKLSVAYAPTPAASKRAIKEIGAALQDIGRKIAQLDSVHQSALQQALALQLQDSSKPPSYLQICLGIETLGNAAVWFTDRYSPPRGRPRNLTLQNIIGALMLLFERATGKRAAVALVKTGEFAPELKSGGAEAIGLLLRAIDPRLAKGSIVNKIDEIAKSHERKDLDLSFDAILQLTSPGAT